MKIKRLLITAVVMILLTPCKVRAEGLSITDKERLLRIAMAEAEGEDVKGKAAVMEVVLNRVEDERYPNNIHDVLFQEGQFATVAKGGRYWTQMPDTDCVLALVLVENGIDFANGALYFNSHNSCWQDNELTYLFKLGNHKFYK